MSDTSPLGNKASGGPRTLTAGLFDHLRERLSAGEWRPGQRLPGEHQLAAEYEVSRATVRTALRQLESFGLTVTRRGSGTYATATATGVRADLRRLESLSTTIAACGQRPGMVYNSRTIRPGTPDEILRLELQPEELVLATERSLTADEEVVAFSYDAIPRSLLPEVFDPTTIESSLFQVLAGHGLVPASAVTELHASRDPEVGWGRRPQEPLYVLLDQVHYLPNARPVMHSRTFFHEGRFLFSLVRAS